MRVLMGLMLLCLAACRPLDGAVDKVEQARERNDGPAIWVVTDEDSTLYLYGTLHIIPAGLDWQRDDMWDAFERSGTVFFEVPSTEASQAKAARLTRERGFLPLGETLSDNFDDYERKLLEVASLSADIPLRTLDSLQPWLASEMLVIAAAEKAGLSAVIAPDEALKSRARRSRKYVSYLDTVESQLALSTDAPVTAQYATLRSTMERYNRIADELKSYARDWVEGDVESLETRLGEAFTVAERERVLAQRNRLWAERLADYMDGSGTGFAAVGIAHLLGEDSLVAELESRDYSVKRYFAFQGENVIRTIDIEIDTGS